MTIYQIGLKKLRESLKKQIQTNKIEISKIERTLRNLKRKNSKLEVKVAEVNGEIIKNNNGGKDVPVYFCDTKGMI